MVNEPRLIGAATALNYPAGVQGAYDLVEAIADASLTYCVLYDDGSRLPQSGGSAELSPRKPVAIVAGSGVCGILNAYRQRDWRNLIMSDVYTLRLQNFRSIKDATVDLAPLTVVYGRNGSGKSSLIYGLLTLRNFLANPNQNLASLFAYPSITLGGWQEVVHRHATESNMELSIGVSNQEQLSAAFTLALEQTGGAATLSFGSDDDPSVLNWPETMGLQVSIPYGSNQISEEPIRVFDDRASVCQGILSWNGVTAAANVPDISPGRTVDIKRLNERANLPMELARNTGFVPLRRGFSKPNYGLTGGTGTLASEDEVASLLGTYNERFRKYEVSKYVESIASRRVVTETQIGTSTFTIDTIPTDLGVPASIVNEGFGINQLVYLLTICLYSPFKIVAIEEPEIHLHPSMVRQLAGAMMEIARTEGKRLVVSTHSEVFVIALLTHIASGKVDAGDVSFILAENESGQSTFASRRPPKRAR